MTSNQKVILLFFLLLIGIAERTFGQFGFPYCETFQEGIQRQETVLGGTAALTDGVLRLTEALEDQNGYVYIDIPFPSGFGIKVSFEYFSYGGTGADGLTVFLFDAQVPFFSPGGFGGSLGYAPREGLAGLTGAYIGIGLDSFGNFGNGVEGKNGGFPGASDQLHPNSVAVRGPGQGFTGYEFITGVKTNEAGGNGLPVDQRFVISSGGQGSSRITDPNLPGYRKVFIDLEPDGDQGFLLSMDMMVTVRANSPETVRIFDKVPYAYPAPEELKIGFAASTGGDTNFHEIRNLIVEVSDEESLLKPEGVDIEGLVACEGQDNIFEIPTESISLPNENSRINCIRFFETYEEAGDESGEICEKSNCGEKGSILSLPEGFFSVIDKEGGFMFTPNVGFQGEEVSTYYTLTDNFGKTSEPKLLKVTIREAPVTLTLFADGVPLEEIFLCPGADIVLEAYSEEGFEFYEWYKDEVLMTDTDDGKTVAREAGEYFVKALNENGCPVYSNTVAVGFPDFPQLVIEGPVTVCNPGLFPDIRDFIEEYNEEQFDYGIETPEGDFLVNEEMDIQSGGLYHIRVKPMVLDCWSNAVPFEVSVPETELEASVDYHLNGTGMKEQSDEGILTDDEVYFVDTSSGDIVSWEWDFGDGETSNLKSPVHVYGQKGDFRVFLTVKNREGCVSTSSMDIAIKRSYRIMFPNGFTPSREEDRYFRPKVKGIVKMELMVFSAWGELLFKSEDLEMEGWDGTLNGKDLPPGRYVYRADFESRDGEYITRSGKVLLIR